MEKATVASLVPLDIFEEKPGVYPGTFAIRKAEGSMPKVLIVGSSIYYKYVGDGRGDSGERRDTDKKFVPPEEIARSIVEDYLDGQLARVPGNAEPAIFWVPGEESPMSVTTKYPEKVKTCLEKQDRWFKALVTLADDDWEKHRQHKIITDTQRMAAKFLGLDRPWVVVAEAKMKKCGVCKTFIDPEAVVCPICKVVINQTQYQKYKFAGAA